MMYKLLLIIFLFLTLFSSLPRLSAKAKSGGEDIELLRLKRRLKREGELFPEENTKSEKNKKNNEKLSYSKKLKEKEKRKIRGFWLAPWYSFVTTLGAGVYVFAVHNLSGHLSAYASSSSNSSYVYHYGNTQGGSDSKVALISLSPFLVMKSSQLVFGSMLLYGNFHPAVSLPLYRLTWFSMYHFSALTFYNALGAWGDISLFSEKSGINFAVISLLAFLDWFVNVVWLSDLYAKSYEESIYKKKEKLKINFFTSFDGKRIQGGFNYYY